MSGRTVHHITFTITWTRMDRYFPTKPYYKNSGTNTMQKLDEKSKELMLQHQIDNICELLKATYHYTIVLDSYGRESKRLTFTYDPKESDAVD